MRVLVTGGAGFIGSAFVRQLVRGAYPGLSASRVTVLDLLTYAGNLANLAEVAHHPRLRFVRGDICDVDLAAALARDADLVVHFAAESHVDRSIADSRDFVRTNVQGTQVLLDAALAAGTRRFVHVSTDEVYGSIERGSWAEDQPLAPNSPYAAAKAASDLLALAHHRTHGLDVRITRCSNNYGPYQHPEKVLPLFVSNLLDGLPVPLYGDGGNVREWLHVDDHCRAIALVATSGRPGRVYHVGGGAELSNRRLTERLLDLCGADASAVRRVADRKGHDRRYSLDSSRITRELGFVPRVPFERGLAETVAWYRENRAWWEPLKPGGRARALATGR
ncbi:dTDP-glucose 4,6-dehydratase [Streptomyces radicis]|uniref:dTDP-glucose 4,6-dehydratase n=1 Tax=Streptomyces radicis TaxID=1750517 RepID=A0A3A9WZB1_9ACTN|nr:dTDP-glucose 4,6-dehydratase [Streptomyces radicis]RKN11547.1 dTDP-glucose 4,6-dehydratase [Streptomyces radicis]RKN26435.1 dTDP-glucose 4,6-dehydratase [Streptomyces radicis]